VFQVQFGSSGENLRVECGGVAVPGITGVTWTYLGHQLSSQHHKYQILTSAEQNYGFRSTLLVRQSGETLNPIRAGRLGYRSHTACGRF
jgi:hypothetical protein